jgi:hypothetical protein
VQAFLLIGWKGKNLSKQSRRKKQRVVNAQPPANIIFTFAATRMLKDALRVVDTAFLHTTKPLPNLELGIETLESLKRKLDDMLQGEDLDKETPFDYNELHVLYAAIHMYLVDLSLAGNKQMMPTCLQLCKQVSRVVEALPPKTLQSTTDN